MHAFVASKGTWHASALIAWQRKEGVGRQPGQTRFRDCEGVGEGAHLSNRPGLECFVATYLP